MRTYFLYSLLLVAGAGFAQDTKYKARVSALYTKVMNQESFISLSAKYKGENGVEPASGLEFHVYKKITDDSLFHLGTTTTNQEGMAKFILTDMRKGIIPAVFSYVIKIEGHPKYADAETEISISDANLMAAIETIDSVNQITATLTDVSSGQPLPGQQLKVQLQRMYAPLQIGEENYETDESGSIVVPIEDPMPGINGMLTFEVMLSENETYGTVKALVTAPIGTPIVDESTFDQRTMWSPPSKTPYFLLIFPNLIILGAWMPIVILLFNLYRISKSKTKSL